jgi:hypothetical protein
VEGRFRSIENHAHAAGHWQCGPDNDTGHVTEEEGRQGAILRARPLDDPSERSGE